MKSKSKFMSIAIIYCVVVCGITNILYYGAKYGFNLIMISMSIRNIISSFTLTTGLSLSDVLNSGELIFAQQAYPAFIKTATFMNIMINAYALANTIAPLCTAWAVVLSASVFFRRLFAKKTIGKDKVIVFGYNEKVKKAVEGTTDVTIITRNNIDIKEENKLRKKGLHLQLFDIANENQDKVKEFLAKLHLENVKRILIMDSSDAVNFSIYQRLVNCGADINKECIVKAECSSDLIQQLFINSYQDSKILPIVLFTSRSLTANTILNSYPVYEALTKKDSRILIIGFGQTGQQIAQRITNEALTNSATDLYIDVVDRSIDDDRTVFLAKVSEEFNTADKKSFILDKPEGTGKLEIHFHQYDITTIDFVNFLKKQQGYDYCAVITGDSDSALEAIIRIDTIIKEKGWPAFPIIGCNDRNDEVVRYINDDSALYKNIHFVQKSGSLEMIFNETNEKEVIEFYDYYDDMNVVADVNVKEDEDEWLKSSQWNSLDYYQQAIIRKMYNHQLVIKHLLVKQFGDDYLKQLDKRFGENGYILQKKGDKYIYGDLEKTMLVFNNDELALELAKLEHRRWCQAMILDGYKYGEEYDSLKKTSPWLLSWKALEEQYPEVCLYRLKSLLYMIAD